jgi:hypothetical protein
VFVLLLVVARMVGLGLLEPNATPSLPNQYGVGGWDLKSYVDYCWFSLKRQRLRLETTMLCLSACFDLRSFPRVRSNRSSIPTWDKTRVKKGQNPREKSDEVQTWDKTHVKKGQNPREKSDEVQTGI